MTDKTKVVEVAGQRWQFRRMTPVQGSYIWQRLMAAMFRSAQSQSAATQVEQSAEDKARIEEALAKATPEDRLRTTCGIGFMFLTFEEMEFVQKAALAVTSRLERPAGAADEQPMPVQMSDGRWAVPELEDDPNLVTQLTTEALVFNLASFLRTGGATTTAT